jgi:hypothetical protein
MAFALVVNALCRYKAVMMHQGLPIPPTKNDAEWKTACGQALKAVEKAGKSMAGVQIGKTMVLYKAVQHKEMELIRNVALEKAILTMQRFTRGWHGRVYAR